MRIVTVTQNFGFSFLAQLDQSQGWLDSAADVPGLDEEELKQILLQCPGMLASILLLDPDGSHVRGVAAPDLPEDYVRAMDGLLIGPRVGSCGTAAFTREPVIVGDIATDPLWNDVAGVFYDGETRLPDLAASDQIIYAGLKGHSLIRVEGPFRTLEALNFVYKPMSSVTKVVVVSSLGETVELRKDPMASIVEGCYSTQTSTNPCCTLCEWMGLSSRLRFIRLRPRISKTVSRRRRCRGRYQVAPLLNFAQNSKH